MNHRTGRLTRHDFDPSHDVPARSWFIGPIEHASDFGVIDAGETFKRPAPQRDMWADEREFPWLIVAYIATVLLGALVPHVIARLSSP